MVDAKDVAGPLSWRKVAAVVLSVGIRPCSGAILVLVFALTQGLFWAGAAAAFAMTFGTAIRWQCWRHSRSARVSLR
jgi:nickel/cobalt exporter